jgi:hypothetical protein
VQPGTWVTFQTGHMGDGFSALSPPPAKRSSRRGCGHVGSPLRAVQGAVGRVRPVHSAGMSTALRVRV